MPNDVLSLVRGAEAVAASLGHFDLHDSALVAVRIATDAANVPGIEIEFELSAGAADHHITLAATDVSDVSLADFGAANVVSEYTIAPDGVDGDGHALVRVAFTCAPGCDLDFRCRDLAVRQRDAAA